MTAGWMSDDQLQGLQLAGLGTNVQIGHSVKIIGAENITIGSNVVICDFTLIVAAQGFLDLHDHVYIGSHCYLGCAGGITIKNFAGCATGCRLISQSEYYSGQYLPAAATLESAIDVSQYAPQDCRPIVFEKYTMLGANSVVLPGVVLKEGAAVGAMSLVTKSLVPWTVYFGSPARRLKRRKQRPIDLEQRYRQELARVT